MLIIRFQRLGKKNEPSFRIVLTEKHHGPQKKYLEELGFYNPREKTANLKTERILYWLSQGAKISASCHNLLIKKGVITGSKIPKHKGKAARPPGDLGIEKEKIKETEKQQEEIKTETGEAMPIPSSSLDNSEEAA